MSSDKDSTYSSKTSQFLAIHFAVNILEHKTSSGWGRVILQLFCICAEKYEEIVFAISCIKRKKMKNENTNCSRVIYVQENSLQSTLQ